MKEGWRKEALALRDPFERKLFVAGVLEQLLAQRGVHPVIVGGFAVEWHTRGLYQSADIDLLCPTAPLSDALATMGFQREGRHWYDADLGIAIEAPGTELEAYRNKTVQVQAASGHVTLVSAEESILDRLRACVHWQSALDCEQALQIMVVQRDELDWAYLERRAVRDQVTEELAELRTRADAIEDDA